MVQIGISKNNWWNMSRFLKIRMRFMRISLFTLILLVLYFSISVGLNASPQFAKFHFEDKEQVSKVQEETYGFPFVFYYIHSEIQSPVNQSQINEYNSYNFSYKMLLADSVIILLFGIAFALFSENVLLKKFVRV